jgi:glycine cleavage system transcriptional repressor
MRVNEFAVAAIGDDRPGMVAALGEALLRAGASIEDSSMTILGGSFAMLLLVQGDFTADRLGLWLEPVATQLDLDLTVRETKPHAPEVPQVEYVIAAYGPDRPGLVVALAKVLAARGANITNFGSRLTGDGLFAMWFNVTIAQGFDVATLTEELRRAGGELSLDVSVHEADAESL